MLRTADVVESGKETSQLCAPLGLVLRSGNSYWLSQEPGTKAQPMIHFLESISQELQRAQIGEEYIKQKMGNNFHNTQFPKHIDKFA